MKGRPNIAWTMFRIAMMVALGFALTLPGFGQTTVGNQPTVGIRERTPQVHAFTHATIVVEPGKVLKNATLLIRNGIVKAVGTNVPIPPDAVVHNLTGKTITPGFIEAYAAGYLQKEAFKNEPTHFWTPTVTPERAVVQRLKLDPKKLESLRSEGFVAALIVPPSNVIRGQSALIFLNDGDPQTNVIKDRVAQHIGGRLRFRFGEKPTYPTSLMGAIALVRQTLLDAQWYQKAWTVYRRYPAINPRPEINEALAALAPVVDRTMPVIFEADDEWNYIRAARIAREFGLRAIIRASGQEYQRIDLVKAHAYPSIVPLNFPKTPNVADPEIARTVSLQDLMHWELAPTNPAVMAQAGIEFALTTNGLRQPAQFRKNLKKAMKYGLDHDRALAALTTIPARLLGVSDRLGDLNVGKRASFIISSGDVLDPETQLLEVWIDGKPYPIKPEPEVDPRGTWKVTFRAGDAWSAEKTLKISGKPGHYSITLVNPSVSEKTESKEKTKKETKALRVEFQFGRLVFAFKGEAFGRKGILRFAGIAYDDEIFGTGELEDGTFVVWSGKRLQPAKSGTAKKNLEAKKPESEEKLIASVDFPFGAYGRPKPLPDQPVHVLIRNATIWTLGPQGTLKNADMLIERGKIKAVGHNLKAPKDAIIIDATGKHVTPGLIDAHSHTAVSGGVNEVGQAVTAEVRIGDVLDPENINIYRQLAGGLTIAHILHGSANPIGGQNQVIKLRWGADDEGLKFKAAPPTIKFALGENPKQSNWGERFTTRYPQTRMGVEQIIRDRFQAAREYKRQWEAYRRAKDKARRIPPRRDLELETLLEILEGKRFVHSHSYRQDEILALMRVAEDFGFRIAAFQHVLEGYKVADELARHGAGASTFSDWWAYKFEVYDAIPYNGALMWEQGVVVSFNSDSSELARRLNLEAAKAVKYGGVPEEEALKFVTLNPAKQLKIDHRVGSLEPGKDADFVIWSGHPLSTFTVAEQTWIDGRKYFDRQEDRQLRKKVQTLRARLIQKALKALQSEKKGGSGFPMRGRPPHDRLEVSR